MAEIRGDRIGIAFDMQGCPNRCRHCYLGQGSNRRLSESDVRWGVSRFRSFINTNNSPVTGLSVSTWFREPDYSEDYRKLYELETELSDGKPFRYELLSTWRLARDKTYAEWARSIGPDTCQISLAGMEEVTDWFYRRKGAFKDAAAATDRLLDIGMKPRWQIFLTTKLLPDIEALMELAQKLHLRERVHDVGGEFQIFIHPPGPDHEGRKIEEFRPTASKLEDLPEELLKSSRKHLKRDILWRTEEALIDEIISSTGSDEVMEPEMLWFFICGNWDVYSNAGTLEPWWRLGNMKKDRIESIFRRYETDDVPGLQVLFHKPAVELAQIFGNPAGQKIYSDAGDLLSLYRGNHCEKEWNRR
jgi:sulfatase maturation enzyme AslB (radical SAM superfamily)